MPIVPWPYSLRLSTTCTPFELFIVLTGVHNTETHSGVFDLCQGKLDCAGKFYRPSSAQHLYNQHQLTQKANVCTSPTIRDSSFPPLLTNTHTHTPTYTLSKKPLWYSHVVNSLRVITLQDSSHTSRPVYVPASEDVAHYLHPALVYQLSPSSLTIDGSI